MPYSNASAETGAALNIEAGAAILVEANSGKNFISKRMQMNYYPLLV